MRSSTASLILAFCAGMAVQAAPVASETNTALINRDVEDIDMEMQEPNLSKKRSVGGFLYHGTSSELKSRGDIEKRNNSAANSVKNSDDTDSSDSDSDSDSDSQSDSDEEDGAKIQTRAITDASSAEYSSSNSLEANDPAKSFEAEADASDEPANSYGADANLYDAYADSYEADADSYDADADSYDADADSYDADADSYDADADAANSFETDAPDTDAEALKDSLNPAAQKGTPTDSLTAAVVPKGAGGSLPPKNGAENLIQGNSGIDENSSMAVSGPEAGNSANLQANSEASIDNLETNEDNEGDVIQKRDPGLKKKQRKFRKNIRKKVKKAKGKKAKGKKGRKCKGKKCKRTPGFESF